MEYRKPHEIVNRLLEARDALRSNKKLESTLTERIFDLPEDDYCRNDVECLQLGAGYAQLMYAGQNIIETSHYGTEHTMSILQAFYATRPVNRYQDEQQIQEHQKLIHESVLNHRVRLPDHIDPYEVSAASMFLEGYGIVTAFYDSRIQVKRCLET